jgi:Txe/YoeB family toxin of toxin-antitoxin system
VEPRRRVVLTKQAAKDAKKLAASNLRANAEKLLQILQKNPYQPPYEALVGNLAGFYSRRINIQYRLVYQVLETERVIKVLRMWSHYE